MQRTDVATIALVALVVNGCGASTRRGSQDTDAGPSTDAMTSNSGDGRDGSGGGAGAAGDGAGLSEHPASGDANKDADTDSGTSAATDAGVVADRAPAVDGPAGPDAREAGVDVAPDVRAGDAPSVDADSGVSDAPVKVAPWPGANMVTVVDNSNVFGADLSGLAYQPATPSTTAVLWGVDNGDARLYRMTWNGSLFVPTATEGWSAGKALQFPTGTGSPDCEGVTKAEWDSPAVYISSERDNDASGTSRLSVLRYDTSGTANTLRATHEWNLTADLPAVDPNKGIEAVTWIPDSELVGKSFVDERTGATYVPGNYADHGTGLFFVGLEATGTIYAYALNHTASTYLRVATIASGQDTVMDLSFDRDVGTLWSTCDDTCGNQATLLDIDTTVGSATRGRYRVRAVFDPPSTLPNAGNEGIAIGPEAECVGGRKPFLWADDSNTNNHAIRRDSIPCGRLY